MFELIAHKALFPTFVPSLVALIFCVYIEHQSLDGSSIKSLISERFSPYMWPLGGGGVLELVVVHFGTTFVRVKEV